MIKLKIDCKKIDKNRLFRGEKGTYLDAVLFENKDGRDKFGYDGFIAHDVTKEEREAGQKGAIIGNWKDLSVKDGQRQQPRPQSKPQPQQQGPRPYGRPQPKPQSEPRDSDPDIW